MEKKILIRNISNGLSVLLLLIFGNIFSKKNMRDTWVRHHVQNGHQSENKTINIVGHNNSVYGHDDIYDAIASLRGLHLRFNFIRTLALLHRFLSIIKYNTI